MFSSGTSPSTACYTPVPDDAEDVAHAPATRVREEADGIAQPDQVVVEDGVEIGRTVMRRQLGPGFRGKGKRPRHIRGAVPRSSTALITRYLVMKSLLPGSTIRQALT